MALGLILGYGGVAAAPMAFGGLGLGWWVLAGIPFGVHANNGEAMRVLAWIGFRVAPTTFLAVFALCMAGSWIARACAKRLSGKQTQ
jgi:hypothetical protein